MQKIIYHIAVSLDGFIADSNGGVGDFLQSGEHADDFLKEITEYGTVIMGRSTYEFGFDYGIEPGQPAYPKLKHIILGAQNYPTTHPDVQVLQTGGLEFINRLRTSSDKPIWLCGGGKLAGSLFKAGLIDELRLKVNPIVMAGGISLFEIENKQNIVRQFKLHQSKTYDNSVQLNHFVRI